MSTPQASSSGRPPLEFLKHVPPVLTAVATFMAAGATVFGVLVSTGVIHLSRAARSAETTVPQVKSAAARPTPAPAPARTITVEPGTDLYLSAGRALTAGSGQRFEAILQQNVIVAGKVAMPAGSRAKGTVAPASQATAPTGLSLTFDTLIVGRSAYALSAVYDTSVAASKVDVGAAAGALVGRVLGKQAESTVSGVVALRSKPMVLPANATIKARVLRAVTVPAP